MIRCKCNLEVAVTRIARRDRKGEEKVNLGYLRQVEQKYDVLYNNWDICPKMELDTEFRPGPDTIRTIIARIKLLKIGLHGFFPRKATLERVHEPESETESED